MPTQVLYGETVVVLERRRAGRRSPCPTSPRRSTRAAIPAGCAHGSSAPSSSGRRWSSPRAHASSRTAPRSASRRRCRRRAPWRSPRRDVHPLPHTRADLVRTAKRFLGLHYLWGGLSAWGYDCSGLTWAVYRAHGITIPRDADAQFAAGTPVALRTGAAGRPALLRAPGRGPRRDGHRRRADDRGAELGERGAHRPDRTSDFRGARRFF